MSQSERLKKKINSEIRDRLQRTASEKPMNTIFVGKNKVILKSIVEVKKSRTPLAKRAPRPRRRCKSAGGMRSASENKAYYRKLRKKIKAEGRESGRSKRDGRRSETERLGEKKSRSQETLKKALGTVELQAVRGQARAENSRPKQGAQSGSSGGDKSGQKMGSGGI